MKLWVVVQGENSAGYSISDILKSEAEADQHVDQLMRSGEWNFSHVSEAPFGQPSKTWAWGRGVDYIEMQEWEI